MECKRPYLHKCSGSMYHFYFTASLDASRTTATALAESLEKEHARCTPADKLSWPSGFVERIGEACARIFSGETDIVTVERGADGGPLGPHTQLPVPDGGSPPSPGEALLVIERDPNQCARAVKTWFAPDMSWQALSQIKARSGASLVIVAFVGTRTSLVKPGPKRHLRDYDFATAANVPPAFLFDPRDCKPRAGETKLQPERHARLLGVRIACMKELVGCPGGDIKTLLTARAKARFDWELPEERALSASVQMCAAICLDSSESAIPAVARAETLLFIASIMRTVRSLPREDHDALFSSYLREEISGPQGFECPPFCSFDGCACFRYVTPLMLSTERACTDYMNAARARNAALSRSMPYVVFLAQEVTPLVTQLL